MRSLLILAFVFCVLASFLFSGMEAGVFALNRLRVRQQMRKGNRRAHVLYSYLENPEGFLWTIVVGNTLANLVVVGLGAWVLYAYLGRWPVWLVLAIVPAFFLYYAFCELLPKTLFRLNPNRLCISVAPLFRFIYLVLKPIVALVTLLADSLLRFTGGKKFTGRLFGNREELRRVMQESSQSLTSEERTMINRVLDLQNISLLQIAIPMSKVVSVSAETPIQKVRDLYNERGFSRMPVWRHEGGRQRVVGMLTLNSIIFGPDLPDGKTAGDFLKPALYLDQDLRLEAALRQMQRKNQRLAIVLDPKQNEWGIVSLQDILRVIFGEVSL
jgi:CBS domain containing-hemolysin-like protein